MSEADVAATRWSCAFAPCFRSNMIWSVRTTGAELARSDLRSRIPTTKFAQDWRRDAIAAGAAIGVVSAATAAAWAGPASAGNMCWYYTDPSQRQGLWDE